MDYEKITDILIGKVMQEFDLEDTYQEFLDSLIELDDYKNVTKEKMREYLDNLKIKE